jgi:hypothetical protein
VHFGPAAFNAWLKHLVGVRFLRDGFIPPGLTAGVLAGILALAAGWAAAALRRSQADATGGLPGPDIR